MKTGFEGMEYFGSQPEKPKEVCLKKVAESDVYIGIFAHRYGSIPKGEERSITELEYRHAREKGIPCLIYLKDEKMPIPPDHIESDPRKKDKLSALKKELMQEHTCSFFTNPDNLAMQVVADLHKIPVEEKVLYTLEPEMILIPAGGFLMGSDPSKDKLAFPNEQPQHTLYLPDYYLAKTPVTNAQYVAFLQDTGHDHPGHWKGGTPPRGKDDHPVVGVSWHDAVAYCNWLFEVIDKPYRLPSEAEWEKGARGTDGRIYPWDSQWDARRCNSEEGGRGDTTPVEAYPEGASPYGLLDMAGNVWEWTRSLGIGGKYVYPYKADDGREGMEANGNRVVRGGSWRSPRKSARCAARFGHPPGTSENDIGFRVVVLG